MPNQRPNNDRDIVNNDYYDTIGSWWDDSYQPVALLRAEGRLKNQWVKEVLKDLGPVDVLDVGCGGGFLTNELAGRGHHVTGVDLSESSLAQAKEMDGKQLVKYVKADAYSLPFANESFQAVTCFDFLEHVSRPEEVIAEVARVIKPGGYFFYHTFNKNWIAELIAIKGVEWFVKGTPSKLHVIDLFIKPKDLHRMMAKYSLGVTEERGIRPVLNWSFLKLLFTGRVEAGFRFRWSRSRAISYAGLARRS